MTTKPNLSQDRIVNPRYEGASPEEVAKALLRKWGETPDLPQRQDQESTDADDLEVA